MSGYDRIKAIELQEACLRLKKAMQAQKVEAIRQEIVKKGNTLYSVRRTA
jgi:hypothetical protein